jgi:hypothetical protein
VKKKGDILILEMVKKKGDILILEMHAQDVHDGSGLHQT